LTKPKENWDDLQEKGNHHQEHRSGSLSGVYFLRTLRISPLGEKNPQGLDLLFMWLTDTPAKFEVVISGVFIKCHHGLILRVIHETVDEKILGSPAVETQ